jgi:drug/metabolite transporter (DMT)-like permease
MPFLTSGRVYLVLALAILATSLAAIMIRLADAPGIVVAAYRMTLASLALLPFSLRGFRATPPTRRTLRLGILAGVFLGAHFATWITSLSFTSVAASTMLVATTPLWIALIKWLFMSSPPSLSVLLGILVATSGAAVIGFGDLSGGKIPLFGDALALAGAIFLAGYFLLGQAAQRSGLGLQAYIGIAYGIAAVALIPLPAIAGFPYLGYTSVTMLWIGLLALIPTLIGHTGINFAMKHLDATLVATLILLEPIGATVFAYFFFREIPPLLTLIGVLLVLLGITVTIRPSSPMPPDDHRKENLASR